MRLSLQIIKKNEFPIQVSTAYYKGELASWEEAFADQGIKTILKLERTEKRKDRPNPSEYFSLWRQVTAAEINEIKQGLWIIRDNGFRKPERYKA